MMTGGRKAMIIGEKKGLQSQFVQHEFQSGLNRLIHNCKGVITTKRHLSNGCKN
jgi:hypothetical protein